MFNQYGSEGGGRGGSTPPSSAARHARARQARGGSGAAHAACSASYPLAVRDAFLFIAPPDAAAPDLAGAGARLWDAACPISTGGGTRRVRSVRGAGGAGAAGDAAGGCAWDVGTTYAPAPRLKAWPAHEARRRLRHGAAVRRVVEWVCLGAASRVELRLVALSGASRLLHQAPVRPPPAPPPSLPY